MLAEDLAQRIEEDLEQLSLISAKGDGVTRLAYTPEDAAARQWFRSKCADYDLIFGVDDVGNCFGWTPAGIGRRCLLLGSHLDSVIDAGKYDGTLGVAAALELAAHFGRHEPNLPLAAASFACEESTLFGCAPIGSRALVGELKRSEFRELMDRDGRSLEEALRASGITDLRPRKLVFSQAFHTFLELHVDQGTVLTSAGIRVGLVTQISGMARIRIEWIGEAAHSGARLRGERRDALVAAAAFIVDVNKAWNRYDRDARRVQLTVGYLTVSPNSPNTVPGEVTAIVDIRSGSEEILHDFQAIVARTATETAGQQRVEVRQRVLDITDPVEMDRSLMRHLRDAAVRESIECRECLSLAGHDAQVIAHVLPTAMLLLANPSGISHAPREDFDRTALVESIMILVGAIPELARAES